ncbi:MAG: nuclear transport factor 2 family protein [Saprospiraceae bacterium]|nr:nuclear transport factor 2 family protein [Saprospiraceae bacterium]
MKNREHIIGRYVAAYNDFDIDKMVADLDASVKFENISNGVSNMTLIGLEAFRAQAEQAKNLFSERRQTIMAFYHQQDQTEIEIDYFAVLDTDLPNGLKKGDKLQLSGKSVFKFSGDKIIGLTDIS